MRSTISLALASLAALPSVAPGDPPRTVPDPLCAPAYAGTSGMIGMPADPGLGTAASGGEIAPPEVSAALPERIVFRSTTVSFNRTLAFAIHGGRIYARTLADATAPWRTVGLPACLDGNVTELSADGDTLVATDRERWLYTVSLNVASPAGAGWTRRWGPFFWTDLGMALPEDVVDWVASDLSAGEDGTFTDRAGNQHEPFGILNLYLLRGDRRTITTLDPWLPSDESREVCTPARGTTEIAALSGSGSTALLVEPDGTIWTRLYEFDVAGSNTVFYDYAWEDQTNVASPRVQLPAPDWIRHPDAPGTITDRVSLSKVFPAPTGRLLRIEGSDALGRTGYFEKTLDASNWRFVETGDALQGTPLPRAADDPVPPADLRFDGTVEGWPASVLDFNAFCSPATLRIAPPDAEPFDLVLHSIDGLRQERRGAGLDGDARGYRSALEVPAALWDARAQLEPRVRAFLERWFAESRFLDGPMTVTRSTLRIGVPCWTFSRAGEVPDQPVASASRDLGAIFAGFMAAQEEDRAPSACTAADGAP